jgi:hypothetical protein
VAITSIGPAGTIDQAGLSRLLLFGDGVVGSSPGSTALRVDRVAGQDRRVTVQPGSGRVPGVRWTSDAVVTVDLPANATSNPRLDWIIARTDWGVSPATTVITSKQGTAAASPARPSLTQTPGVLYELQLGLVRVDAGVGALPANAMYDGRYWETGSGVATIPTRSAATIDPPHRGGRQMFVVDTHVVYVSDGSTWYPTNFAAVTAGLAIPAGWQSFGAPAAEPTVSYRSDGVVRLAGRIRRTNDSFSLTNDGALVATVPTDYRPSKDLTFAAMSRVGWVRVDVLASGGVLMSRDVDPVTFPQTTGFVSLDGITYSVS